MDILVDTSYFSGQLSIHITGSHESYNQPSDPTQVQSAGNKKKTNVLMHSKVVNQLHTCVACMYISRIQLIDTCMEHLNMNAVGCVS
jgi:hypothetical protein